MRRLILKMSISLDGFVGGPNGEIDWLFRSMDAETTTWTVETLGQVGLHIMGRRTFRDMAAYWPYSQEAFARPMNAIPKMYFSRGGSASSQATTQALVNAEAQGEPKVSASAEVLESWKTARVGTGDLSEEIAKLKQEPGKDILAHGGASFAQSLVQFGLIDEYRLLTHPVALGRGLPLFSSLTTPLDLDLVEAKIFPSGVIAKVYRPRK